MTTGLYCSGWRGIIIRYLYGEGYWRNYQQKDGRLHRKSLKSGYLRALKRVYEEAARNLCSRVLSSFYVPGRNDAV